MDDEAIRQAMLVFGGSLLLGPALGGLVGWRKGFEWGFAVGALLIGAAGLYGAGALAWHRYQSIAGTQSVRGSLVEFVDEVLTDDKGRRSTVRAPIVEYTTPDGQKHRVKGLGGSAPHQEWGDAVEVRYSKAQPAQAIVADFQNMWGGVWALGLFGGFPTIAGLFLLLQIRGRGRVQPAPRRPTPGQERWRTAGTVLANTVFLGGFVLAFLYPTDNAAQMVGIAFMTVGAGAMLHFIVQSFPPAMPIESRFIFAIVGLGFFGLGFGVAKMG